MAVVLASFLLFVLEPMMAKRLLPGYGGSATVWITCLVFYQAALLAGYAYAAWLPRLGRRQFMIHLVVVLISLLFLPIGSRSDPTTRSIVSPEWQILWQMATTIGLPFAVLASTSPLVQSWRAQRGSRLPYRLYALSNAASLAALLAFPVLIEPNLPIGRQLAGWSGLYIAFVVLILWEAASRWNEPRAVTSNWDGIRGSKWLMPFTWAFCSSVLLLAITNHMTQNVAAVPLLWVLPLATYLLTFALAFSGRRPMNRALWLRVLAFALGSMAFLVYDVRAVEAIQVSIPVLLAGLFLCCYFCHGELFRIRPEAECLGGFYLAIAAGGAAGAVVVGVLAPLLLTGVYELPLALLLLAAVTAGAIWAESNWALRALALGVCGCMAATVMANVRAYGDHAITSRRSFYGALRVVQTNAGPEARRTLYHGTIEHGSQYLLPPRRTRPATYYGPESGAGIVLRELAVERKRVGIIGLGVGTLAAYGQPGDSYRFFELNPQVSDIAGSLFTYLRESKAAVETVIGDGRIRLTEEHGPRYHVLVLDAFSGDAIPVHLLTREAFAIYRGRLEPDGVLLVHVSNNFLQLAPVVARLATAAGWQARLVHNKADAEQDWLPADWMVVTNNEELLTNSTLQQHGHAVATGSDTPLWTDGRNDLLHVLKTPGAS